MKGLINILLIVIALAVAIALTYGLGSFLWGNPYEWDPVAKLYSAIGVFVLTAVLYDTAKTNADSN